MTEREAVDPTATPERLTELADAPDPAVRRAVASNPNTPLPVLYALAVEFAAEVLANPVLPLLMLEDPNLLVRAPAATVLALLRSDSITAPMLAQAAVHPDHDVQRAVASHPMTPGAILERLARIQFRYEEVAANPAAPAALLEYLAGHSWVDVRREVVSNPSLLSDALQRLLEDEDVLVRNRARKRLGITLDARRH